MEKKKMDPVKKIKLIYSGELIFFSILFIVLSILFYTGVIGISTFKRYFLSILSVAGGTWSLIDFIWFLKSPKRRKKYSLLDKCLILPVSVILLASGIVSLCLISSLPDLYFVLVYGIALDYFALIYLFESVYHYHHPIPGLIEDEEPAIEKAPSEPSPTNPEANPAEEPTKPDSDKKD